MRSRLKAERDGDRQVIIAALEEAGRPLRIDELLRDAWGITRDYLGEKEMRQDLAALERSGKIVAQWPGEDGYSGAFLTYRLATAEDHHVKDDHLEVARLMSQWEPADG